MSDADEPKTPKKSSRREFIRTAGLVVAGGAIGVGIGRGAGVMIRARRKSLPEDAIVLGRDEHLYEWQGDWAKLPQSKAFGYTQAICEDSQGRILIFNNGPDTVAVFDPDGNFMGSWGSQYEKGAHGMQHNVEDGQEYLYLSLTSQHKIAKTTVDGEIVWEMKYPKEAEVYEDDKGYLPTNIAIAPNGDFYVGDGYGSNYVHQYTRDSEYVRTWGGTGSDSTKFNQPHGIWVDTRSPEPRVVVADRGNQRLVDFTLDGELLRTHENVVHTPCHFDQRGQYLLVPELWGRVTILDSENNLYSRLGEYPGATELPNYPNIPVEMRLAGKFTSPHECIWDRQGNIFCVEWIGDGRVTKLRHIA